MTITRFLLPGVILGAFTAPAVAQFGDPGSRYSDLVPSVRPAAAEEPLVPARPQLPPMPPGRPAAAVSSLEQMTAPPGPGTPAADPDGTLTGQPNQYIAGLPPGSYPSPYYVDGPGCCGPLGRNGRIGYELYTFTGANFVFGPGLPAKLFTGWQVGGGARTLFFTPDHTAAWVIDLGLSYTHNGGRTDQPLGLFLRTNPVVNQQAGTLTLQPDRFVLTAIHGVHRESFNFNLGRDVWLWGAGNTGGETGTNLRVGGWVGGRYGSSHIDLLPLNDPSGYSRRQNVFEGVVVGGHITCETPMGGWILFGGLRAEYGYDWTNLAPPIQGNLNNINLQVTLGIRF
jgi:hypothetical protein